MVLGVSPRIVQARNFRRSTRSGATIALTAVAPGRSLLSTQPPRDEVYEGSFEIAFDEATTLRGTFRVCAITKHRTPELGARLRQVFARDESSNLLD